MCYDGTHYRPQMIMTGGGLFFSLAEQSGVKERIVFLKMIKKEYY